MLFNSIDYFLFLPAVLAIYFATPQRLRWAPLLAASYYFYMCWNPKYLALILTSTLVDYVAALGMGACPEKKQRRSVYLAVSLLCNLGLLFTFKYYAFFAWSVESCFDFVRFPELKVLLPVGISFYTFQTLSYTIDVYRGDREPERHLGIFALYVSFFPQLVAGPIERSTHFIPQLHRPTHFDERRFVTGFCLILWGLVKKLVVADRLAIYVDSVYGNVWLQEGPSLLLATYFFAFQIYCDFSAYSDIAIGSARIMGYDLLENFRTPYFSRSIGEFWRRWHITLGAWFREYVYIPLGGSRSTPRRVLANLLIVFLLSGLWHGANWTFVIWGAIHGAYLVVSRLTAEPRQRLSQRLQLDRFPALHRLFQVLITFHLVCFGWIFFRAASLDEAVHVISQIATGLGSPLQIASMSQFVYCVFSIVMLLAVDLLQGERSLDQVLGQYRRPLRWAFYASCVMCILLIGVFDGGQFIYFQF